MLNLSLSSDREKLEELLEEDVDKFCETYYEQGHRNHLGGSEIGKECHRQLWYGFRWTKQEHFDGRMMRLFNVGHAAEPRFVAYLRGIGFEVKEFDENGKQFRISGAMGHYGGSLDGKCKAPERYQLSEDVILSLSFKTNNTGAGYAKVASEILQKSKPQHWAQECAYGYKTGIRYCIYMIENKNDSDITFKVVELDLNYGAQLEKKAESIIFAKEPPPRISENPAMFNCKFCHQVDICHHGAKPEKNCRSCRNSMPTLDASWTCSLHGLIPPEFVKTGCNDWLPI